MCYRPALLRLPDNSVDPVPQQEYPTENKNAFRQIDDQRRGAHDAETSL